MNNASVGPVERSSMISTLEAASQQHVLPICSKPVQEHPKQGAGCKCSAPFLRVSIVLGQYVKQTGKCICSHLTQLSRGGGLPYVATKGLGEERDAPANCKVIK